MEVSGYTVRIPEGNHFSPDPMPFSQHLMDNAPYVELMFGRHYSVQLNNSHSTRCQAKVTIDGKHIGTWVLPAWGKATIERPVAVDKKFTFFRVNSREGARANLQQGDTKNGLIQVEFTPEKEYLYETQEFCMQSTNDCLGTRCYSKSSTSRRDEGGTGLQGKSNQRFRTVSSFDLDYSAQVTINIRLVGPKTNTNYDDVTPLGAVVSNPIPPPL